MAAKSKPGGKREGSKARWAGEEEEAEAVNGLGRLDGGRGTDGKAGGSACGGGAREAAGMVELELEETPRELPRALAASCARLGRLLLWLTLASFAAAFSARLASLAARFSSLRRSLSDVSVSDLCSLSFFDSFDLCSFADGGAAAPAAASAAAFSSRLRFFSAFLSMVSSVVCGWMVVGWGAGAGAGTGTGMV